MTTQQWRRVRTPRGVEYRHANGGRVYPYGNAAREWGVQGARDPHGFGGYASLREAKVHIERFGA